MSSRHLHLAASNTAPQRRQTSHLNPLDRIGGRGRSSYAARRVSVAPVIARMDAMAFWADLVQRRCGTREEAAVQFEVTFQTACNWFDGFSCPTGDKVLSAMRWWPEEFVGEAA